MTDAQKIALAEEAHDLGIHVQMCAMRHEAILQRIDEADAAARTGSMPATLSATLAGAVQAGALTSQQSEDAALTWAAMYTALRSDALWGLFVATGTATNAQIDALFVEGAAV